MNPKFNKSLRLQKTDSFSFSNITHNSKYYSAAWLCYILNLEINMGLHYSHDNRNSVGNFTYNATKMNNIGMNNVTCE